MSEQDVLDDGRAEPDLTTSSLPLMTRLNRRGFRLVQAADALSLAVILVGSMWLRHGWDWPTYPAGAYAGSFTVVLAIFVAALYFGGMYEREARLGPPPVLPRAFRLTLGAGGTVALLNLIATGILEELGFNTQRALPIPIPNLVALIVLGAGAVAVNRRISSMLRLRNEGPVRIVLVGDEDELVTAREHLEIEQQRAVVTAEVTDPADLLALVMEHRATTVMLLSARWLEELYPDVLLHLEAVGVNVLQRVTPTETMFGLARVRQVGGLPFVLLRAHTLPDSRARFKRFTDLIFLLLLMPVVVPVLALTALYVLAVAGRPILFWQDRVGVGGHLFRMVKFRTMVQHAEEDGNPRLATREDPRIIRGASWLRATRLDELPQVYNILRGEMSLVGPRPERPELTSQFELAIPGYAARHEVPPGLTGLAQIHGRYHTDPEYKLGYDLQYLVNWSPVLDLEILARTVWVVVTRRV